MKSFIWLKIAALLVLFSVCPYIFSLTPSPGRDDTIFGMLFGLPPLVCLLTGKRLKFVGVGAALGQSLMVVPLLAVLLMASSLNVSSGQGPGLLIFAFMAQIFMLIAGLSAWIASRRDPERKNSHVYLAGFFTLVYTTGSLLFLAARN
jgi:hypothetical protein